ncbi:MAG: hypothetical protein C4292_02525 [Nitrososphaera sp.]
MATVGRKRTPSLVTVRWHDAVSYPTLQGTRAVILAEAVLVKRETVGFLVYKDNERTILAHDLDEPRVPDETEYANITVIPTGWILEIVPSQKKRTKRT